MNHREDRSRSANRHAISNQLRDIIDSRGLTGHAVGKLAGVDPGVVKRFLTGVRDVRLETVDRLAAALGLRLVEVGRRPSFSALKRPTRPEATLVVESRPPGRVESLSDGLLEPRPQGPILD
jgi:transcriptional regulator with XRE-family HTH domain